MSVQPCFHVAAGLLTGDVTWKSMHGGGGDGLVIVAIVAEDRPD